MNADRSKEETVHNFLDEFTNKVSIHLLWLFSFDTHFSDFFLSSTVFFSDS